MRRISTSRNLEISVRSATAIAAVVDPAGGQFNFIVASHEARSFTHNNENESGCIYASLSRNGRGAGVRVLIREAFIFVEESSLPSPVSVTMDSRLRGNDKLVESPDIDQATQNPCDVFQLLHRGSVSGKTRFMNQRLAPWSVSVQLAYKGVMQ